ncbi:hypothetical protein SAMN05444354_10998 [Stigmatella aurantiaca]|uniref:DUF1643 domain-containing protein n=1 Tax=Stigmatella aurantiaca TaxID=41 RepID=A0A1H7TN63_STIAU|nr:DUF1643 domain-containing protein [Stigmatella aurantiaca]SEL86312.1 hypothetical protein SAMN05444354_10998 [Stigmatella aurantiaca]
MAPNEPASGAEFDSTNKYRYRLWRIWGNPESRVLFILLNPSTATAMKDDPTIRRCLGYARGWGYGALEVCNLFAYRATYPKHLRQAQEPIGAGNDAVIQLAVQRATTVLVAWGANGAWQGQHQRMVQMLSGLKPIYCLGLTKAGYPKHPLRLRSDLKPVLFSPSGP